MPGAVILAHVGGAAGHHALRWTWDAGIVVPLAIAALVYGAGVARVWRIAGAGRGVTAAHAAAFAAGWIALAVALVSPVHELGERLFAAHMTQHMLLIAVAAPLLVLGRPVVAALHALPGGTRAFAARVAAHRALRRVWTGATDARAAWVIHGTFVWAWHMPALYERTIDDPVVHAAQHVTLLGSAVLFWWSIAGPRVRGSRLQAIGALFATVLHTGALGALLTFSRTAWYASYGGAAEWGLTAREDQELAGLIMWIPGGLIYTAAALLSLVPFLVGGRPTAAIGAGLVRRAAPLLLVAVLVTACHDDRASSLDASILTGGDPVAGRQVIRRYGCQGCHTIPGVPGARATVGPSLAGFASGAYVAGVVPNTPENLLRWIMSPRSVDSLTAMPGMGVTEEDARDIAAYLYTLR